MKYQRCYANVTHLSIFVSWITRPVIFNAKVSYACSQDSSLNDAMEEKHISINIHANISAFRLSESTLVNPEQCQNLKLNLERKPHFHESLYPVRIGFLGELGKEENRNT